MPETILEPGTRFLCGQCRTEFEAKNRNGVPKRFCSSLCRDRYKNARRLQAAASLHHKKRRIRRPSKQAQQVSQCVFMALVPVEERAELLRLAAERLGITDRERIEAALRRAQVQTYEGVA